ncbi:hypothetical protein KC19_VG000100 [Ceratodon purpureus]|uniref:Uncharacterized protein n=1 Tax=Ceratodon purpureus TaxID=3225 RepID=A0A8T0HKF1_CERPU|nr:hypothetical protein KC19_6G225900 [Ceratodon purpureus]KAG0571301.1 hypothetical protein KC19_VG000100 [Ceratodon purpureus]
MMRSSTMSISPLLKNGFRLLTMNWAQSGHRASEYTSTFTFSTPWAEGRATNAKSKRNAHLKACVSFSIALLESSSH